MLKTFVRMWHKRQLPIQFNNFFQHATDIKVIILKQLFHERALDMR